MGSLDIIITKSPNLPSVANSAKGGSLGNLKKMPFYDKFDKEDYYLSEEGYVVFTEAYHLKRGYCCQSGCKHCPWKNKEEEKKDKPSGKE